MEALAVFGIAAVVFAFCLGIALILHGLPGITIHKHKHYHYHNRDKEKE